MNLDFDDFDMLVKQKVIDLCNKRLNDDNIDPLIKAIEQNTDLEELRLGGNKKLTLADGKFANAIAKNTTLKVLWLDRNNISPRGVKHLADALKMKNNTLQKLYLWDNDIGDEGAKYIADMLIVNKTLQAINLSYNKIGDKGALSIAASLTKNTGIQSIDMGWNKIGNEGAGKLADALESNHFIKDLHLYDNISKDVRDRIKVLTHKNRNKVVTRVTPSDNANTSTNSNGKNSSSIGTKPTPEQHLQMMAAAAQKAKSGPISDKKMPANNNKKDTAKMPASLADDGLVVTQRELKVDDALLYLDKVKIKFGDQSHIYNGFLEIMKDLKAQKVDILGVINRLRRLFHGHIDLILGFNTFLPDGYKIEMKEGYKPMKEGHIKDHQVGGRRESEPPKKRQHLSESIISGLKPQRLNFDPLSSSPAGTTTGGKQSSKPSDQAVKYIKTVKKRFAPEIYRKFLQILHEYQKKQCGVKEVVDEVSLLFEDHADLLKEFVNYLPGHAQAQAKKQLEGPIKKAEEKKASSLPSSHSVNDELSEQKDLTKDEEIAMLQVKLKALEEVITTKDKEIASLKESLKNSKPIDVVDMTDNTSSKQARTENTSKSGLAIQYEQNQRIVQVKEEKVAAETSLKSVREEKQRIEDEKELALECKICFEMKEERYALVPCGHIMCSVCKDSYRECPTCSRHVDSHLRVHL